MSTNLERFTEWHIDHESRKPMLDTPEGMWLDDKKAWAAWEESKRQALERAARFMEARADQRAASGSVFGDTMSRIYRDEAKSIRALVDEDVPLYAHPHIVTKAPSNPTSQEATQVGGGQQVADSAILMPAMPYGNRTIPKFQWVDTGPLETGERHD